MEKFEKEYFIDSKIGSEEFYNLITGKEVSWQSIIYDLINTEKLDPWNIDLVLLTNKYLERIKKLEEENFFISSKVLLAAALLLRIKSEILINRYIKSLDEILFGKEEKPKIKKEFNLEIKEIPPLFLKTPLPRYKKVSLQELINALNKAISTENRRIKKELIKKQIEYETEIVLPKKTFNIREKIRNIYARIITSFKKKQSKISYSELTNDNKEEKKICFLPILHLDSQKRILLEQEKHFDEIYIWLYKDYKKNFFNKNLQKGITKKEEEKKNLDKTENIASFDDPLANFFEAFALK
ncbi:MAG: segregation/condensation protein A [Candidatus Pacearchaeota archaeon]